jgi:uncharacterized membrane protein
MDDRRIELTIGRLLRAGVLLAAAIVTVGGLLYLAQNYSHPVSYRVFETGGPDVRTLRGILQSAISLHSEGLIQLGLLVLIATPVARVIFAVIGFGLERDRLYVVVSLIVLAILTFSLMHAI